MRGHHNFYLTIIMTFGFLSFCQNLQAKKSGPPKSNLLFGKEFKPQDDLQLFITKKENSLIDFQLYRKVIGAANEYKEGDEIMGLHAPDQLSREYARQLIGNTPISFFYEHPIFEDEMQQFIWSRIDLKIYETIKNWPLKKLKSFILSPQNSESEVKKILPGLNPHAIGSLVKLMNNDELGVVGKKIFFIQENSMVGASNYFGARVQPNSPTDNPDDIAWQVFDAWSYAVGDVMLGTNPVDSNVESVASIEEKLKDIIQTFEKNYRFTNLLPWVVLAHIDIQKQVEDKYPGLTSFWFQSLAGTSSANKTFGLSIEKLVSYAKMRTGPYSFYFETGQGADFTNGHGHGFDMVIHEANKYALARILNEIAAENRPLEEKGKLPFMVVNDVAGFIGPEVYQTKEQLVRTTLEDIAMGKLSGLTIGLDICSTLHMSISLDDLEWAQDEILKISNPAYAMALPTRNDPMLSYLTTSFQDHVRLRTQYGTKLNDKMWSFFQKLKIIDSEGMPTEHFGDPRWVYFLYLKAKGDIRSQKEIFAEAEEQMLQVQSRGVPLAIGHGDKLHELNPKLDSRIRAIYQDSKIGLWTEWREEFLKTIPHIIKVSSQSKDRQDYIYHPFSGEKLTPHGEAVLTSLSQKRSHEKKNYDLQIVISDGLDPRALMDSNHLAPYLAELKKIAKEENFKIAEEMIVIKNGRVRIGYQIGRILYGHHPASEALIHRGVIHLIGERPGTGHHNFSAYIAFPKNEIWKRNENDPKKLDHDQVKLVSGISDTSLNPKIAAQMTIDYLKKLAYE